MAAELEGEPQPGPTLTILESRSFDSVLLFHTRRTEDSAHSLKREIRRRHDSRVVLNALPIPDSGDYAAIVDALTTRMRTISDEYEDARKFASVSGGSSDMRAVWFVLAATGAFPLILLRVGSPDDPLYGSAKVEEVPVDSPFWSRARRHRSSDSAPPLPAAPPQDALSFTAIYSAERMSAAPRAEMLLEPTQAQAPAAPLDSALRELGIFVGSALLQQAAERVAVVAETDLPVLLLGETGTGKDLFAKLVHHLSPRCENGMVPVNCAAIPKDLVESYLFGHVKGAFTGATMDRPGKFESADGTTLFLDEIGELPLEAQAKLLRVLNDGEVERVGSNRSSSVDVRIIAATNRNLRNEVACGHFREDLYYRLEVVQIPLPALRERRGEIPHLAAALLQRINERRQRPRKLSKKAMKRLEEHDWPGNVRELSNVLERSVLYAQKDVLEPEDLLISVSSGADPLAHLPEPAPGFSLKDFLSQVRTQLVLRAMEKARGNQSEAAELLGLTKQAVSEFLKSRNDNRP